MKKGIGLMSLIMYVIGLTVVIAIITTFNLNIFDATRNFTDITRISEQYTKFNKFFINSAKTADYVYYNDTNSTVTFYNSDDTVVAIYTFDETNNKITYSNASNFATPFDICLFVVDDLKLENGTPIGTNKYNSIIIGPNTENGMFTLNNEKVDFINDVTYIVGRGY